MYKNESIQFQQYMNYMWSGCNIIFFLFNQFFKYPYFVFFLMLFCKFKICFEKLFKNVLKHT